MVRLIKVLKEPKKKAPKVVVETPAEPTPVSSSSPPSRESSSGSLLLASSTSSLVIDSPKTTLNKSEVNKWAVADVSAWMGEEGFSEFVPQFEKNLIDGDALLKLDADSLRLLGMELVGTKLKFLGSIDSLRAPGTPTAAKLAKPGVVATGFSSSAPSSPASPSSSTKKTSGLFKRVSFTSKKESEAASPTAPSSAASATTAGNKDLQEALSKMDKYQKAKSQEPPPNVVAGTNVIFF